MVGGKEGNKCRKKSVTAPSCCSAPILTKVFLYRDPQIGEEGNQSAAGLIDSERHCLLWRAVHNGASFSLNAISS